MAITLQCPACKRQARACDDSAVNNINCCPGCGAIMQVRNADSHADAIGEQTARVLAVVKDAWTRVPKSLVVVVFGLVAAFVTVAGLVLYPRPVPINLVREDSRNPPEQSPAVALGAAPSSAVRPPREPLQPVVPPLPNDKVASVPLDPAELITTITVTIHVGAGPDLQEPVALDLGLGYPLWLQPVGRKADEPPPRGGIPQQSTAGAKVAAGESATFTFSLTGEAGQDRFRTSEQLLANTRVADVVRVGFASKGTTNWVLAGYAITINYKRFADGTPNVKAGERERGRKKLAELNGMIANLQPGLDDMRQLDLANQLEQRDKNLLTETLTKMAGLVREKAWLAGQLEGKYPWFVDPAFKPPAAGNAAARSAKVTLITFARTSADTANYVYARIGGHKYFVSSPDQPLTGLAGAQVFDLDLLAGPLSNADLGGWALGMLGNAEHYDRAPDWWHGQRVRFEIDGRICYDSEQYPADRTSLASVRLIPPAHLDKTGQLVINREVDGQVYLWDPTKRAGTDPATQALAPPPPGSPLSPLPENPSPADNPLPAPATTDTTLSAPATGNPPPDPDATPDQPLPVPNLPEPPPPGIEDPGAPLAGEDPLPPPADNTTPTTSGPLPQIDQVRFTDGRTVDGSFTVEWNVTGDESQIEFYQVELLEVRPDQSPPLVLNLPFAMPTAPPGKRISSGMPAGLNRAAAVPRFLVAHVTAVPKSGTKDSPLANMELSAARMVFPGGTILDKQPQPGNDVPPFRKPSLLDGNFRFGVTGPPPLHLPITASEQPLTAPSVWFAGEFEHQSVRYEAASEGFHLGVRPAKFNDTMTLRLICKNPVIGKHKLLADLGFQGAGAGSVTATIIKTQWFDDSDGLLFEPTSPTPAPITALGGSPTAGPLVVPVDPAQTAPLVRALKPGDYLVVTINFTFSPAIGLIEPPVLFGVRMIPD